MMLYDMQVFSMKLRPKSVKHKMCSFSLACLCALIIDAGFTDSVCNCNFVILLIYFVPLVFFSDLLLMMKCFAGIESLCRIQWPDIASESVYQQ